MIMVYDEYKKLTAGCLCVIIQTGEAGKVLEIDRRKQNVLLVARRAGRGVVKEWFNYTQLARI